MKKLLLTMRVMLLVAVACVLAMPARADVTVNVLAPSGTWIGYKTSSWDANSATWEELTATTYIDGLRYYTKTLSGNDVYFAFSRNNISTYAIHGTSGTVNYVYDGYNTAYGTVPSSVKYDPVSNAASNTYYFFYPNTAGIANPQAYVWNESSNNDWNKNNGSTATVVGQDGAGNDIYKFVVSGISFRPANVIFHNGDSQRSAEFACSANDANGDGVAVKGGYYSDYNSAGNESFCVNGWQLNSSALSTIKNALTTAAADYIENVNGTDYITTTTITRLDLSDKSISDITGIEKFPGLRYLDASKNSISFMELNNNTKLYHLNASSNPNLLGFGTGAPGSNNHVVRLPSGCLEYLDMSSTRLRNYAQAAFANKVANTLETFIARDVYFTSDAAKLAVQNIPGIDNLSKLKYLDVSGCDGAPATIVSTFSPTQKGVLEYLDISNQHMTTSSAAPSLDGFTALKTFKFGSQTTWNKTLSINNCKALTSVDLTGNSAMIGLNINNCDLTDMSLVQGGSTLSAMTTLNVDNNLLSDLAFANNFAALTTLSIKNNLFSGHYTYNGARLYPVQTIDMSNNSGLTGVSLLNNCVTDATASNNGTRSSLRQVTLAGCPSLTTLAITGADIYIKNQFAAFDATNKTTLQNLNFTNNNITHYYNNLLDGSFTALNEIDLSSNPLTSIYSTSSSSSVLSPRNLVFTNVANLATVKLNSTPVQVLTITGSPLLETVDVTGETGLTTIDLSSNGLTSSHVPTITGWTTADAVLKYNDNGFSAIPSAPSNVSYLYLLRNEFASDLTLDGSSVTYKGVALSNKSTASPITSLTTSGSNSTLEALNLDGNTGLTDLTIHNFTGLTQTASNADMTTAAGKGLYIKGLTALENIDIAHNAFEKFGQDGSTTGLSAVKTLDASHNALYTFSNKTAIPDTKINGTGTSVANGRPAHATFSTLEDLTALETLNLSNNQLCDSVHLWKNRNLKRLDVSNNRTITERAAGSKRVYRKGDGTTAEWATMVADRYTGDLNDTIGVRMLDLFWNQQLEYIDISNTAIQNTAMDHTYMNNFVGPGTTEANAKPEKVPHFILVNRCKNLKEFHADNNGMKSLGIGSLPQNAAVYNGGSYNFPEWVTGCPKLEIVSVKGARGQDPNIMKGELNVSQRTPNVWYYDVSDGGFDYIGTANGANLKYLNVSGNYNSTNQYTYNSSDKKWHCTVNGEDYTTGGNPFQLNVNVNSKLETLMAQDCPKLQVIVAENLDNLTAVDLTQHAASDINQVYIDHNSSLPGVTGLETLTELHTLWVNDDPAMAGLDVTANTKLERLHAQNNPQFGVTDTKLTLPATSSYLKTLWVSGDNLGDLNSDKDLNVSGYAALDSLLCDNNRLLYLSKGDNLATNTALRHLNCDNNLIADLSLASASQLEKVNANDNDLFKLDVSGNHPNLVELKFANNHVNGIALAGATSLTQANYDDTNNGRQITANHQRFYTDKPNQGGVEKDLYYFQLVNGDEGTYGKWVSNETSTDSENHENVTRVLGNDGFDASKWASATVSRPNQVAATADDVNANKVYGTIAVLTPTSESSTQASGRANYEYNNGNSAITSNFYLDWTANPTVFTSIEDVPATGGGVVVAGQGALIVNGATAGQVLGIYDLQGREVRREVLAEGVNEISLPAGIYIVNGQKVMIR